MPSPHIAELSPQRRPQECLVPSKRCVFSGDAVDDRHEIMVGILEVTEDLSTFDVGEIGRVLQGRKKKNDQELASLSLVISERTHSNAGIDLS